MIAKKSTTFLLSSSCYSNGNPRTSSPCTQVSSSSSSSSIESMMSSEAPEACTTVQAIALNDKAAICMRHAQPRAAIAYLQEALALLASARRPDFASYARSRSQQQENNLASARNSDTTARPGDKKKIILIETVPYCNVVAVPSDMPVCFFNGALTFSPILEHFPIGHSEFFLHLVAAVLTYNLGLALHLTGLETGCSVHLCHGLDCYVTARARLTDLVKALKVVDSSVWFSICFLALANNMGHICSLQRAVTTTHMCTNEIALLLTKLSHSPFADLYSKEELRPFYLNVHFSRLLRVVPAPAA